MPTDFDSFTPAAMLVYQGNNANVRSNLNVLQRAMARSGFYGLRTEWWHFCAEDWAKYPPIPAAQLVAGR
jgi:D-alanyl-D-alanine dipeptidase